MNPVTLVLNPNARKLKLRPGSVEDFRALLPPHSDVHLTHDLNELDEVMGNWKNGERTLCFYGGDGSISQGITSLIRQHGESFNLPPVLPVRAGTFNMLCNLTGRRETADRTLSRWFNQELTSFRVVPTLKVEIGDEAPRYGFVFAWGIGYRVLSEYYRRTSTPNALDAAAVATQAFMNAIRPDSAELPLFRKEDIQLKVDGELSNAELMHTLTIGTIARLSLGMRPFPRGKIEPGSFQFSANGMPIYKVAAWSPTLLFGLGDQTGLDFGGELVCSPQARELECVLTEGFSMDGELFPLSGPTRFRISSGPAVRFWTYDEKRES